LFDSEGKPVYTHFITSHWATTTAAANPEVIAEVSQFLTYPTHFFAACQSINAFENLGFFLTPNGFAPALSAPAAFDFFKHDSPLS
jgi:hypothetical protein